VYTERKSGSLTIGLFAFERLRLATDLHLVRHSDGHGKGMLLSPPDGTVQRKQLISLPSLSMALRADKRSHVPLLTPLLSFHISFSSILSAAAFEPRKSLDGGVGSSRGCSP
jgi:hypothetical protein